LQALDLHHLYSDIYDQLQNATRSDKKAALYTGCRVYLSPQAQEGGKAQKIIKQ
jgi:hypothetical protein